MNTDSLATQFRSRLPHPYDTLDLDAFLLTRDSKPRHRDTPLPPRAAAKTADAKAAASLL